MGKRDNSREIERNRRRSRDGERVVAQRPCFARSVSGCVSGAAPGADGLSGWGLSDFLGKECCKGCGCVKNS